MEKFNCIIKELELRGFEVRRKRNISTYIIDAVVSPNIAILKTPTFSGPIKADKYYHYKVKLERVRGAGWKIFVVPKGRMSKEQINEFVDSIEATLDGTC